MLMHFLTSTLAEKGYTSIGYEASKFTISELSIIT